MKSATIFACCLLCLVLAAFSPTSQPPDHLRTSCSSQNKVTYTYTYDAQGRLSGYSTTGEKATFTYTAYTVTETNSFGWKATFILNAHGLADSMYSFAVADTTKRYYPVHMFSYSGNPILRYYQNVNGTIKAKLITKKFNYGPAGFLTSEAQYVNGNLWTDYDKRIANGNISSAVYQNHLADTVSSIDPHTGKMEQKIVTYDNDSFAYTYLVGKANSLDIHDFYGKASKNLIATAIRYSRAGGTDSTLITYHYTFDGRGRVATLIKTEKSTDPPQWNEDARMTDTCVFTYY